MGLLSLNPLLQMRRHPSLIPFSKQHHQILVLAQVLKTDVPDYKGMPVTSEGKLQFIISRFEETILPNFTKHRKIFYPALIKWSFPDEGLIEHIQVLEDEILQLCKAVNDGYQLSEAKMSELGYCLDTLVRTKERHLYEMVQARFGEELKELDFEGKG